MNNLKTIIFFNIFQSLLLFACMFISTSIFAKNLGVWGAVFPVVEQDIKEFIHERLNQMQQNGALERLKKDFIQNVKNHTLRPTPVAGLTVTEEPKTFYYDPTYVLDKDITDEKGKAIAKAGITINPLDTIKLHGVMFFLNADDKRQVKWALENAKKYDYVKYILVEGNIKDAGKALNDRIYFDQYGVMVQKLGIKHIPCIVKQVGKKLQIKEVAFSSLSLFVEEEKETLKVKETKNNKVIIGK